MNFGWFISSFFFNPFNEFRIALFFNKTLKRNDLSKLVCHFVTEGVYVLSGKKTDSRWVFFALYIKHLPFYKQLLQIFSFTFVWNSMRQRSEFFFFSLTSHSVWKKSFCRHANINLFVRLTLRYDTRIIEQFYCVDASERNKFYFVIK